MLGRGIQVPLGAPISIYIYYKVFNFLTCLGEKQFYVVVAGNRINGKRAREMSYIHFSIYTCSQFSLGSVTLLQKMLKHYRIQFPCGIAILLKVNIMLYICCLLVYAYMLSIQFYSAATYQTLSAIEKQESSYVSSFFEIKLAAMRR